MAYQTDIAPYVGMLKRRKYFLIIPVIASLIISSAVAYKIPAVYRSEAKIYYFTPQIPENMLASLVNIFLETAIKYMEATIFSRDRCLQIINEVNLYPDMIQKMPTDDVIANMKEQYKSTNVYESVGTKGSASEEVIIGFKFYFDDRDPKQAFNVATIIASDFVANYKKFREGFATVSSTFFYDEQQRLKEEMAKLDKKISEFKEKHLNELPELFQNNYQMVQSLNQQLLAQDQEARFIVEKKIMLESQLATTDPFLQMEGISGQKIITPEEKLGSLKVELALLLSSVSEKHPDVIRVKREIESLEKIVPKDRKDTDSQTEVKNQENYWVKRLKFKEQAAAYNPIYVSLAMQLEETSAQMKSLQTQKDKIKADMEKYKLRLEKSPVIELEYTLLVRDRESTKVRYDQLVNQALQADSSSAMEKREIGGRLVIVEPPNYPLRPIKPNRPLIVAIGFVIGISLGILLIITREFLYQTVRSPDDLAKITPFPVLSELPEIPSDNVKEITKIRKRAIPLLIIVAVPVLLFAIGMLYKPLELDIAFIKLLNTVMKKLTVLGL